MSPDEKRDRLLEAASVLLEHAKEHRLNAVCLNKALFYLDLVSMRDTGLPVTFAPFVAIHNGPVVAKYDSKLIGELEKAGIAEQEEDGKAKPIRLKSPVSHRRFVHESLVPAIKRISEEFSGNVSNKASEMSHKNLGWQMAYNAGLKAKSQALSINMQIAMQQIIDSDPWLTTTLSDEEEAALNAPDCSSGDCW